MVLSPETHAHLLERHQDFGDFAEALLQEHAARFDNIWWSFVDTYAPSHPTRIIDFGAGPGFLLEDLCERYYEAEIVGVDRDRAVCEQARDLLLGNERVRIIEHDLGSGPIAALAEASAELVIASLVLTELEVPSRGLDEAARVLAPGGALVVYDWIRHPLPVYAEGRRPERHEVFELFGSRCRFTAEDVAWLVETSGFKVREVMTRREGRRLLLSARRFLG